jgi:hypothetical protein
MHSNTSINAQSLTCSIYKVYNRGIQSRLSLTSKQAQYFFLLVRLNLPSSHHACRWSPVHHRITLTSHDRSGSLLQPPISLYSPWPAALAFRRPPVYPSDSLLPQLALSSWIPSSGILQRCGKSGDSSCASSCWCVVRRRERCCAISWVPSSRNPMSTNSHATPFFLAVLD